MAHEPKLTVAAHELAERATAQSESGAFASRQAPEWDRTHPARRPCQLEPALEKRRGRLADDDGIELIQSGERLQGRPRRAFAFKIDHRSALRLSHQGG